MTDELLQFLSDPTSYPYRPDAVEHVQTHISHVFLAGDLVFKFKKPVDFGFLDYSTPDKRLKFCRREVQLNRRLSDDIYLGIIGVQQSGGSYRLTDHPEAESVVEYAVKMRRLEEDYFLHRYIQNDTVTSRHIDRVAKKLAEFYRGQQPEDLAKWGSPEKIKVNTDENFEQTEPFIGQTIRRNTYEAVRFFTNHFFAQHDKLFQRRMQEGCIVDGHGDLHLDHIHITPEKVQIYDCIEFNDRFRYGDWAVDLAFLAMDLDFHGRRREERHFVKRMAELLQDRGLSDILDFYKCYRAYVKGKVKSLQSGEEEVPEEDRKKAVEQAGRYFRLSLRYALLGSRPTAVIFMGRVGTGKSTLARHLIDVLSLPHFSSDRIRKKLAGVPLTERPALEERKKLYSEAMSDRTYSELRRQAKTLGSDGKSVVLDATYSRKSEREKIISTLEKADMDYIFVEAQAPNEVIRQRLSKRGKQQDVISDARLEDFEKLVSMYQSPEEAGGDHHISVGTDQLLDQTIEELYLKLAERNIYYSS